MTEEETQESQGTEGAAAEQNISVGLTPFGQIGINITASTGETAGAAIGPDEAGRLIMHLQALCSMLISQAYASVMKERELAASLVDPGGGILIP